MGIYDTTTKLADEIRNSREYKDFQKSMGEIKNDKDSENLLKNYKFAQVQMQSYYGSDERLYNKSKVNLENIYKKIMKNKKLVRYLESERKFTTMMNKINNIIAKAVEEDYK